MRCSRGQIYAEDYDSNSTTPIYSEDTGSSMQAGSYWVYATTAETAHYRSRHAQSAVQITVLQLLHRFTFEGGYCAAGG